MPHSLENRERLYSQARVCDKDKGRKLLSIRRVSREKTSKQTENKVSCFPTEGTSGLLPSPFSCSGAANSVLIQEDPELMKEKSYFFQQDKIHSFRPGTCEDRFVLYILDKITAQ